MNLDWLTTLIPIVNATGIPLLAVGIILLLRAYQKSVEAYKDTSLHLSEENKRLRTQLSEVDSGYLEALNRMREIAAKSIQATGELQAAKISLLTGGSDLAEHTIRSDVAKINQVLDLLQTLSETVKRIELFQKETELAVQAEFHKIGQLISEIGDTQTRLSIVRVIASDETFQSLSSNIDKQKRGLLFLAKENFTARWIGEANKDRDELDKEINEGEIPDFLRAPGWGTTKNEPQNYEEADDKDKKNKNESDQ